MTTQDRLFTANDWRQLPDDGKRYELINGAIIEMPPSSKQNSVLAAWLIHLLISYIVAQRVRFREWPGWRLSDQRA